MEIIIILGIIIFLLSMTSGSDSYGYRGSSRHRSTVIMSDPYNDDRYEYMYRMEAQRRRGNATTIFLVLLILLLLKADSCSDNRQAHVRERKERSIESVPTRTNIGTVSQVQY